MKFMAANLRRNMADTMEEDLCDSWEDMVDNGVLERKLQVINCGNASVQGSIKSNDSDAVMEKPAFCQPVLIMEEDTSRTQYVPPEPQVKILKRPSARTVGCTTTTIVNGEKASKQSQGKTLQQREAEYAEARLRILGAAKSEEEIAEERLALLSLSASSAQSVSGQDGSSTPSTEEESEQTLKCNSLLPPLGPAVTLIREARGPEPGKNFANRR